MVGPAPSPLPSLAEQLQDVTEALAAARTAQEVYRVVLSPALTALGAIAGAVLLLSASGERLELAALHGHEAGAQTVWQDGPLEPDLPAGDALRRREALYFEHEGDLLRAYPDLETRTGGVAAVATAVLPMVLEERPLGVIVLDFREPHHFTAAEQRFLRTLASQCALALGRVRLLAGLQEEVRRRTHALESARATAEALARLGDALQAAASPDEVARLALERLAGALEARGMTVVRLSSDRVEGATFWGEVPPGLRGALAHPERRLGSAAAFQHLARTLSPPEEGWRPGSTEAIRTPGGQLAGILHSWPQTGAAPWTPEQRDLHRRAAATLGLALERAAGEREREEQRSALDAFVAYQEAVGSESDVRALARQAMRVVQAHLAHVSAAYYEREGERWYGRAWTDDVDAEVVAQMKAGLPADAPNLAQAARTGTAVFVDSWSASGEGLPSAGMYGAAAFVPLVIGGEVRSLFAVGTRESRAWTDRERALVRAVARGLTLTLERAAHIRQLEEQNAALDARTRALQGFADLSRDLAEHRDPQTLTRRALEMVLSLLPPGAGLFYQRRGERWHATAQVGDLGHAALQEMVQAGFPVGQTPTLDLPAQTREALFQDRYDPARDIDPALAAHLQTVATLPVLVEGEVVGIFNVALFESRPWAAADRAVLETTARSLGLALEGARGVEQLAQRTRELERSNAELEQFAYVASHDLQAPIRAMTSFAELIGRRYGEQLDERGRKYLGQIITSGEHMKRLVDDLLAFSRVHTAQREPEVVDASEVFDTVRRRLQAAQGAGAQVTRGALPRVLADPYQLDQLFQNLLTNGLKYRREGVEPSVHVWAQREGERWRFAVRDNGIGIERQYWERIFVIFQRLHGRE
ncbi:hypothetical protein RDMS_08835, partial [Deinococcus sp. RL]|uniref:GAF domain-containing protein n=1 Tax=Deinococcus sp. RL TaxID=1489678 RepID=UPI0004DAA59E